MRITYAYLLCIFASLSSAAQSTAIDSIINPSHCKQIVETLAADSFLGRLSGSVKGEQAGQFIAAEFIKAGCAPGVEGGSYLMPFQVFAEWQTKMAHNIIAILPGKSKPAEWILFSAHYDHIGTRTNNPVNFMPEKGDPEKGDTIYNGANDNASGITALILLARYFGRLANNERTLVFMAFSGEELGLVGSQHTAVSLNHDSIMAMINMDMLGVPISRKKKNPVITGSGLSNLQKILNDQLYTVAPREFGKNYFRPDPYRAENLFRRSDNYWFARQGVPAHTIIATHPRNRFYHSLNDEPATLDYEVLAKNIRALALGSAQLISGAQTPTRINPLKIKE